jgi:hypothetical protein
LEKDLDPDMDDIVPNKVLRDKITGTKEMDSLDYLLKRDNLDSLLKDADFDTEEVVNRRESHITDGTRRRPGYSIEM